MIDDPWQRWRERVTKLTQRELTEEEEAICHEMFMRGERPLDALHTIRWQEHGLHKAD